MNYEVKNLSFKNKIKIKVGVANHKPRLKEKNMKNLSNLISYGMSNFIQHYDQENSSIYLANNAVLSMAKRILQKSNFIEQLIIYETHEKIDNFFLTLLTIKNTEQLEQKSFPIIYLLHEKNDEATHYDFWMNFVIKHLNYEHPISLGKDLSIVNALIRCLKDSESKLFFCSKTICTNTIAFCCNQNDSIQTGIENLVHCESYEKYKKNYRAFRQYWTGEYDEFYSKFIGPQIESNLTRNRPSNLKMGYVNSDESSYQMQDDLLTTSPEFSLSDLIMRLYKDSCQFVINNNQAHLDRRVKARCLAYLNKMIIESKYIDYMDEKKWKYPNASYLTLFNPSIHTLFHFQIADIVIKNGLLHWNDNKNCYSVQSPFNETENSVYDNQGVTECTCLAKLCFHKIASKFVHDTHLY